MYNKIKDILTFLVIPALLWVLKLEVTLARKDETIKQLVDDNVAQDVVITKCNTDIQDLKVKARGFEVQIENAQASIERISSKLD